MSRTLFKLKINISNLDEYLPNAMPCSGLYEAELITEVNNILIKIFYSDTENLGGKIAHWNHNREENLLSYFELTEVLTPSYLETIDFLSYTVKSISNSTGYYESNLKYVIIKVTGVKKKYTGIDYESTEFYLNKQGFSLVEINYNYPIVFSQTKEDYKWQPENTIEDFIKFDNIEFRPEYSFRESNESVSGILIQKEPKIRVKHNGISDEEITRHVSLLCSLFSFYAHENIDYKASKIQTSENYFYEMRDEETTSGDGHGIFRWEFSQNPLNLIWNVNARHLLDNFEFVQNIITRYNYALQMDGESRFMILYNLLEQIRNQYILDKKIEQEKAGEIPNPKKVIEQYTFNRSKNQTDKFIKETLEKIVEIVDDEHKELFKAELNQKINNIKLLSMKNQFESLFTYMNINTEAFDLEFDKIMALRNSIFHGSPVGENAAYLKKVNNNRRFPKLVGIVMLKYFGIDNLSTIDKKWN